jgi:putative transposase
MEISDARNLKALEEENRKLKKLLAETMLDASTLKEMLRKRAPSLRRRAVIWAIGERGYSALQGGAADRAQAWWPQTGTWYSGADDDPTGSEFALVARLRMDTLSSGVPYPDPGR